MGRATPSVVRRWNLILSTRMNSKSAWDNGTLMVAFISDITCFAKGLLSVRSLRTKGKLNCSGDRWPVVTVFTSPFYPRRLWLLLSHRSWSRWRRRAWILRLRGARRRWSDRSSRARSCGLCRTACKEINKCDGRFFTSSVYGKQHSIHISGSQTWLDNGHGNPSRDDDNVKICHVIYLLKRRNIFRKTHFLQQFSEISCFSLA